MTKTTCFLAVAALMIGGFPAAAQADPPSKDELDFFESKIRPLLIEHCYECHSHESGESEGELFLDSAAGMRKGGISGATFKPGSPDKSLLMRSVLYKDRSLQMPPDSKLPREAIESLKKWIQMGAPDPRTETAAAEGSQSVSPISRDPKTHWVFVTPQRPVPPARSLANSRDSIDDFAAKRAAEKGIADAGPANRAVLVRRLYFDLTGLPPNKQQIESFVNASRPDAYTRLVDELLATPEFAERFARHWMDVARYADTVGYALGGKERRIKGSDRFRDWAIRAFAADMPYDEMIMHQIAGDRLDPENKNGNLDAMGFLTIGRRFLNGYDTVDDRIDVITRGLLGMTVACARCHDHKFDPIPTSDYYSLVGVIESSKMHPDGPSPLMMIDKPKPHNSPVLRRGQPGNRGPIAPRQFLTSLRKPDEPVFKDGSGRLELARRISATDNPLAARVMVNRIWSHLIGKSLVDSPSDFGFRTKPPAVPEVLDALAADFASHWSIKRMVRRIVMTRVYQQSSRTTKEMADRDAENNLLTRANRRRRDFESLRDSMLLTADSLDQRIGGEPVEISLPQPVPRRSLYAMIDRQNLPAMFRTFDFASPDTHSPIRYFTTVPQQALFLMNDPQSTELARRTAQRVRREVGAIDNKLALEKMAPEKLADTLFAAVLGRVPTNQEREMAIKFLAKDASTDSVVTDPRSLWTYGTGTVDDHFKVQSFTPLPVFKDGKWIASAKKYPADGPLGYASLGKEDGHPGRSNDQSVIRRYVATADGVVRVLGMVGHRGDCGEGIKATIWAGSKRLFCETQKQNNRPYGPMSARVKKGEFVDIVASPEGTDNCDSFFWRIQIKLATHDGRIIESDSTKDFSGPFDPQSSQNLNRLAQLAQILLISNEFAFVD